MQVRYRETGKIDEVELCHDEIEGPVLVGYGDPFWVVGCRYPFYRKTDAVPDPDDEYIIGTDTFQQDWDLVQATDAEMRQLRQAGFKI
jgi:hypothetical protein